MLLVQDQLATAGPKPNTQEKHYKIEVEDNSSILNQTIHNRQSGTPNLLSSKDFVDVRFDGKVYGGGKPGDQGPGGSKPGNGGPRSKDYGSPTKSSKGHDNTSAAQEIPKIISLDLDKSLVIKKTSQLIIDKEEISIKPQFKKPTRKLTPIDNDELLGETNDLFPDIISYQIEDDIAAREISTKVIKPDSVAKEAKSILSKFHNTLLEGESHIARHNQSHSKLPNIVTDNSNHPQFKEILEQSKPSLTSSGTNVKLSNITLGQDLGDAHYSNARSKSIEDPLTKCSVQDENVDTANNSETQTNRLSTPPNGFSYVSSPSESTSATSERDDKTRSNQWSPTSKAIQEGVLYSPKLVGMYNKDNVSEIDLKDPETIESKNTDTSERSSEEEADKYKGIKTSILDQVIAEFQRNKQKRQNQDYVSEIVRENMSSNEESQAKHLAQDEKISLEIAQPVSNKTSNLSKVQNYVNRITLVNFQLQALQTIEHHIDTWSSTTLTSTTAALPAAGEYYEEGSFSPLTQIMRKGTLVPWISGHYGKSIQGKIKNRAAYRADLGGFSIGSDFVLNECTVLGVSYTKINSKVKYRQDRLGDNATTDSQTFALYGQYHISDRLFAQSAISHTKGLTKHNYINQESYKSSSKGFSGFVTLNNVFTLPKNTFLVSRVGLRYIENKEKDAQVGNAKIIGARNYYLTAVLGSKILFRKDLGDVSITPGLYAGLEQPIVTKNKRAKASIIEAGQTFEYQAPTNKNKNMTYNLGAEISAKRKNLVLSLSYQCSLAKKYANHQGTLKIGLAF